ncbi:ABC transporter ATP-binding protein [Candidatus Omnitrophota bacterium]
MNVIEFNNVWKKFKRGEKFNSLRDWVPNLFRTKFSKRNNGILDKQEFWAIKDVSFKVKKGEVLGIIGPNGAGKSTILKLLSRIMNPTKGEMKITGRLSALIEVTAGFHNELTGRENTYLNGTILGMTRKEIDEKFDEILEFSGIGEFIDTPVKRYSSGMYSRLGFSVAAHMGPDVLLVDEVLSVGDIAFQAKCAQKMRELLDSGTTIVIVSHNISLIQSLCKRVILLDKGEILKEGPEEEVIPYYQDIVSSQREAEIKKKITSQEYKVRVSQKLPVKILDVFLFDGGNKNKESFRIGESISVKINYEAEKKIENPVFSLEIIRADGVICCSSSTKERDFQVKSINGKGSINVDLGKINLAPGIYVPKISIWDKDVTYPYAIRGCDVFKVGAEKSNNSNVVFLQEMKWKNQTGERK